MISVKFVRKSPSSTNTGSDTSNIYSSMNLYARTRVWRPPTDLYQTTDQYTVKVEIAGMSEDGFTVQIHQNILMIQGSRPANTQQQCAYYQMEIPVGDFQTQVELPGPVDHEHIHAEYQDGFLLVHLPKAKPHHISINNKE